MASELNVSFALYALLIMDKYKYIYLWPHFIKKSKDKFSVIGKDNEGLNIQNVQIQGVIDSSLMLQKISNCC